MKLKRKQTSPRETPGVLSLILGINLQLTEKAQLIQGYGQIPSERPKLL